MTRSADLERRAADRRRRMVAYRASGHDDAERWDLEFWQAQGPEARLSALPAIHQDVAAVQKGKDNARRSGF